MTDARIVGLHLKNAVAARFLGCRGCRRGPGRRDAGPGRDAGALDSAATPCSKAVTAADRTIFFHYMVHMLAHEAGMKPRVHAYHAAVSEWR